VEEREEGEGVKERPILFNGEMVRAILDGRKTQTRRLVKPQPEPIPEDVWKDKRVPTDRQFWWPSKNAGQMVELRDMGAVAPRGTIGDRLWVRETWRCRGGREYEYQKHQPSIMYHADADLVEAACNEWRPSIHMPRWASRIDLEITAVRVERVQDITDNDAESEGVDLRRLCGCQDGCATCDDRSPRDVFWDLWQSIYANWDANPWVWVYEFRRVKP
jgi:hypothetical protein